MSKAKISAKEFWKLHFDEYPQNDAEKLAILMMQEYAHLFKADESPIKEDGETVELSNEELNNLIKAHIEKMWGGLEMASVQHFIETGKVNGSFRLRLLSLMKFYRWKIEDKLKTPNQ